MNTASKHIIVELWSCNTDFLEDGEYIEKCLRSIAAVIDVTPITYTHHNYDPQGYTGILIIEESHIVIHTWPEHRYATVDVFTCGEKDPKVVGPVLKEFFEAKEAGVLSLTRGNRNGIGIVCHHVNGHGFL